eukprot:Plantae.Rhodophyta-Palmaria_palmata.ctg19789.p2 GENE.Plantae.Rhodophyta-Palmaria_palmata.ctg19789~~Plantae.Rhodophyta-Palmaria_palmata.ctg19789.p2  ORF type:complete len:102 (-),score=7.76 Plantae.Rhodophyta-Palmaria_palmata.ctg19789:206-511(-)
MCARHVCARVHSSVLSGSCFSIPYVPCWSTEECMACLLQENALERLCLKVCALFRGRNLLAADGLAADLLLDKVVPYVDVLGPLGRVSGMRDFICVFVVYL